MSQQHEDPFSLDDIVVPEEYTKLPKLRITPQETNDDPYDDIDLPCDDKPDHKHKVKPSCAKRTIHTSGRVLKAKAAKPAPPAADKAASKEPLPPRKKGAPSKGAIPQTSEYKNAMRHAANDRRQRSMQIAERLITEAINQALFSINEDFVRVYGKNIKSMKKDLMNSVEAAAEKAKVTAIEAIMQSTQSSATHE